MDFYGVLDLRGGLVVRAVRGRRELYRPVRSRFSPSAEPVEVGFRRLLVLDLASVGSGEGPRSLDLCRRLRSSFPDVELLSGGGVRGPEDLEAFASSGVDGVLFASAFWEGALTREDVERHRRPMVREDMVRESVGIEPAMLRSSSPRPPKDHRWTEGRSA